VSRPTDWSPLNHHGDPIPGDPAIVRHYASHYAEVASAIGTTASRLRNLADDQTAISKAIDEFRDKAGEVAGKISKAQERYSGVASAVSGYATPLEDAQSLADSALARARNARDAGHTSNTLIQHYTDELQNNQSLTDDEKQQYTAKLAQAHSDSSGSSSALSGALSDLQTAIDNRDSAANTAASGIKDVEKTGGLDDSWWDNTKQWISDHSELLDTIVNIAGWVAAVAVVVLLCIPGVDLIVITVIGLVMAGITIANAVGQGLAGSKPWGMAALEIGLAVIPLGAGLAIRPIVKVAAKTAVKEASEQAAKSLMKSSAAQGIKGITRESALETVEQTVKAAAPTLKTGLRSALRYEGSRELAELQALRDMPVLKSGAASVKAAEIASSNMWRLQIMPSDLIMKTGEQVISKTAEALGLGGKEGE
jgi:hypothetical protein